MAEQIAVITVTKVLGKAQTPIGEAVVLERENGERLGVIAERAIWYECSGLYQPDHAVDQTSAAEIPDGQQGSDPKARHDTTGDKVIVDLALGSGEQLEVAMTPRAAQRLRDQLNGLLRDHARRSQH